MDEKIILKHALQNAVKFSGKASLGAVIGKVFAEQPSLKDKADEVSRAIRDVLKKVNCMTVEEQKAELEMLAPELLEKKGVEERDIFEFLGFKDDERVVTAFPPGPEKYPHIGHAKACFLNYKLAKSHKGKFILRFEDTNPKTAKQVYYDAMINDFRWLGIEWDELIYASDFVEMFYEKAEYLISKGLAYVDRACLEEIRECRMKCIPTKDRCNTPEENLRLWQWMKNAKEGQAVVRLKIDLEHQNTTMRDPAILRIIDEPHPRQASKYRIWPNYDFQNAIMDSYSCVDIRLRSKEFEMRGMLQRWIQEHLGMKITKTYEFGRFNMEGTESSGRVIREMIERKELIGWDDPTITTIAALRRRGFLPEAIKNFVLSTGMSKAESTVTWDDLILQNKRLLDNTAKRYSAIFDPVELTIENAPEMKVELHINPNERKGGRKLDVNKKYILSNNDVEGMKEGEIVRLMDCINVFKSQANVCFDSIRFEDFKGRGRQVINWLPGEGNACVEVMMPDKTIAKGVAEKNIQSLKIGEVIQFVRFGFCRLDSISNGSYMFWFTHN